MRLEENARKSLLALEVPEEAKTGAIRNLELWLSSPEFKPYCPQIEWLLSLGAWAGLLDRFCQILPFGTGGRRGPVGVGPNRMNLWTLGASVQGHCTYLRQNFPLEKEIRVALAFDVRCFQDKRGNYNPNLPNPSLGISSKDMAQYAARVYAANDIVASILPPESTRYLATPELSFTIRNMRAHGGLNISASHNPPDDNGGKFYDERGAQPVPPDDQIMADLVDQVKGISLISWQDGVRAGTIRYLEEHHHDDYLSVCCAQSLIPPPRQEAFKVVFTPLHGVGSQTVLEILQTKGFHVIPVAEQMAPDGQFPHVTKTPNPEVPESMDRAEAVAVANQAHLVLATDPDADRLGVLIPNDMGGWRFVNGNEVAAMATAFKLDMLAQSGRMPGSPLVIKTEVTTGLITRIARHYQVQILEDLLVGFKYVAEVLWKLESTGSFGDVVGTPADFLIASEESHGLLLTDKIRDKDAGAAALLFAELGLYLFRKNQTLLQYLKGLFEKFGYFKNAGVPISLPGVEGKSQMNRMMDALRKSPPVEICGQPVTGVKDFRDPLGKLGPLKGITDASSRNVLVFHLGPKGKIALRPSGTEPKAKIYLEVATPPRSPGIADGLWQEEMAQADAWLGKLSAEFLALALKTIGLTPEALKGK
ncbi:MAG: phospho-sugar mutase [Gemmataceae bacterium]|nr:phospho-sugar mutase [Gemmataceae bacterium]